MINKWMLSFAAAMFLTGASMTTAAGAGAAGPVIVGPVTDQVVEDQTYTGQENPQAKSDDGTYRGTAVRGGYRSSPGTYRGGTGAGAGAGATTGGGYRTGPQAPSSAVTNPARNPAGGAGAVAPGMGRFGSFFGGLAAGAFFSHLLNPFGFFGGGYYGGGVGMFSSLFGILIWAGLIYLTYRVVKWLFRGQVR